MYVIKLPEKHRRQICTKHIFEATRVGKFPTLAKDINLQIQESEQIPE